MPATYAVSLVARTPSVSGAPTLTEVSGLVVDSISFSAELNKAGAATVSCPVRSLTDAAKSRLRDLAAAPCEVWIYRDSTLVWAGGVETIGLQSGSAQLGCVDLFGYVSRMGIITDTTLTNFDQFVLARQPIVAWQAQDYGNYGIGYDGFPTSGTLRSVTWLAKDLPNVASKIVEMATMDNGFDFWVDPVTRNFKMASPRRGTDKSASIIFDRLNIESANVALSVAPGDLVTQGYGTATPQTTTGTTETLYEDYLLSPSRITFGLSFGSQTFQNINDQDSLYYAIREYTQNRNTAMFQPGVSISPRKGCDVGDFGVGDTVAYAYDAGLGFQSGTFRISKLTVTVDSNGKEKMAVGLRMSEARKLDDLATTAAQTAQKLEEQGAVLLNRIGTHTHTGDPLYVESPSAATDVIRSHIGTETNNRFVMDADGQMFWGPASGTALDTTIYRSQATVLETGGAFRALGNLLTSGDMRVTGRVTGSGVTSAMNFAIQSDPSATGWRFFWNGTTVQFVRNDTNSVVKTFVIDHPTDTSRFLVHATTESPQNGVEYWGEATITGNKGVVTLPSYFESLCGPDNRQVQLTVKMNDEQVEARADRPGMTSWVEIPQVGASAVEDGKFTIFTSLSTPVTVSWLVKAVRKDVPPLDAEPKKNLFTIAGQGPYTYLVKKLIPGVL